MTRGVYMIKNKKTGQVYIGQSSRIERRWKEHCKITPIDAAIYENGEDNFDFKILEEVDLKSDESLLEREKYWIDEYNAIKDVKHYNLDARQMRNYKNTTGFYRVSKIYDTKLKQGFTWRYTWRENGCLKSIKSVNIYKLQKKVEQRGLPWRRVDVST